MDKADALDAIESVVDRYMYQSHGTDDAHTRLMEIYEILMERDISDERRPDVPLDTLNEYL